MPFFVYLLCARTSLVCCVMLLRHHRREAEDLLFQSAMAFLCFALGNSLLFVDLVLVPDVDLKLWRNLITLAGVLILLLALIKSQGRSSR